MLLEKVLNRLSWVTHRVPHVADSLARAMTIAGVDSVSSSAPEVPIFARQVPQHGVFTYTWCTTQSHAGTRRGRKH